MRASKFLFIIILLFNFTVKLTIFSFRSHIWLCAAPLWKPQQKRLSLHTKPRCKQVNHYIKSINKNSGKKRTVTALQTHAYIEIQTQKVKRK